MDYILNAKQEFEKVSSNGNKSVYGLGSLEHRFKLHNTELGE